MYGIIYMASNLINGKSYIGKTTKPLSRRKTEHCSFDFPKTTFQFAIKKYGKASFNWQILKNCESPEELIEMEKFFISKYHTSDQGIGYNMTLGGDGFAHGKNNPSHRVDVKLKISMALTGKPLSKEHKDKISATLTGSTLSDSHKAAISKGGKGHRAAKGENNSKSKDWIVIFPDGHAEQIRGLRAFCREYKLDQKLMRRTANGKATHHKKFKLQQICQKQE
jgi:group I intron endonuclease